jgi:hypothetical protein
MDASVATNSPTRLRRFESGHGRALSHRGVLCANGWAGRRETPCLILREIRKKLPIRLEQDCVLPGRDQRGRKREEIYISRCAIRRDALHQVADQSAYTGDGDCRGIPLPSFSGDALPRHGLAIIDRSDSRHAGCRRSESPGFLRGFLPTFVKIDGTDIVSVKMLLRLESKAEASPAVLLRRLWMGMVAFLDAPGPQSSQAIQCRITGSHLFVVF